MGQQQLMLVILSMIIIGIAVAQAPILLPPPVVGLLCHPDLPTRLIGALALAQKDLDFPELIDYLLSGVSLF